jgi:hypothetical protein
MQEAAERLAKLRHRVDDAAQAAHHLHPRPVPRGVAGVPAGAAEHQGTLPAGLVDRGGHQGRLADARLAGDEDQPAVAGQGALDLGVQDSGRVLPSDQCGSAHPTH